MPLLATAQDSGHKLAEVCEGTQTVDTVISTQLVPLEQVYEILYATVVERMNSLQSALIQYQEFDTSLSGVTKWLVEVEKTQAKQKPISLQQYKVGKQRLDQEVRMVLLFCYFYFFYFFAVLPTHAQTYARTHAHAHAHAHVHTHTHTHTNLAWHLQSTLSSQ